MNETATFTIKTQVVVFHLHLSMESYSCVGRDLPSAAAALRQRLKHTLSLEKQNERKLIVFCLNLTENSISSHKEKYLSCKNIKVINYSFFLYIYCW